MLVEAGRDELVDLVGDHREGQEARAEERHLDLREQEFERMGVNHVRLVGRADRLHVGPHQDVVDVFGAREADEEHRHEGDEGADQPRPQLDEMFDERGAGGFDLVVVGRGHGAGLFTGGLLGSVGRCGSGGGTGTTGRSTLGKSVGSAGLECAPGPISGSGGRADGFGRSGSIAVFRLSRAVGTGSKLVFRELTESLRPATCFLMSSSSASRMASLNWAWNSPASRRTLAVIWPTVRSALGRSLGPMTISATPPITSTSPQLMSNMARS